jgi:hypothetical protein
MTDVTQGKKARYRVVKYNSVYTFRADSDKVEKARQILAEKYQSTLADFVREALMRFLENEGAL